MRGIKIKEMMRGADVKIRDKKKGSIEGEGGRGWGRARAFQELSVDIESLHLVEAEK